MRKVPMTVAGERKMREELHHLKTVVRPAISAAISEAREHGDLRENAEYHAAREQQGFCEGRITEIERKLAESEVIDITRIKHSGRVVFGCTITLTNLANEESVTYQIVGEDEADVALGKISVISPIARALMGKFEGDEIEVQVPAGRIEFEIYSVRHL